MSSSNIGKTADEKQASLQKEQGPAVNVDDVALDDIPNDPSTGNPEHNFIRNFVLMHTNKGVKSYSEERRINSKEEAEGGDGRKGSEACDSDLESDEEEAGDVDDGPPTWSGYALLKSIKKYLSDTRLGMAPGHR